MLYHPRHEPPLVEDEIHLELVRIIEANPHISQRELARQLGVSLGKVNYCLKALIDVGWIKAGNFARSSNKLGYAYVLTPTGIKNKASITARFLKQKQAQYQKLKVEIAKLQQELERGGRGSQRSEPQPQQCSNACPPKTSQFGGVE